MFLFAKVHKNIKIKSMTPHSNYVNALEIAEENVTTFRTGVEESCVVTVALFPRSICTEMLACDRSTPELCSACVRVLNNLFPHQFVSKKNLIDKQKGP